MLEGVFQSANYNASKALMDVAAERHQALAGNLANAETPGYRRIDLDRSFEASLREQLLSGELKRVDRSAIRFAEEPGLKATSPDGNNVSADRELMLINENALRYEMFGQFVSGSLRQLRTAITGKNP